MKRSKKSPLKYFVLLFALSLPLWVLQTQLRYSGLPLDIPITDILAAFMPLVAACWLTYSNEGKQATKALLGRVFDWNRIARKRTLLLCLAIPVLIFVAIYITLALSGSPLPNGWQISWLIVLPLFLFFFLGAAGEEVGYMGYAFEPLKQRLGALGAAAIIGLPWAIWHYPSMLDQGRGLEWILWGTLGTIAFRVITVWVYQNTNASLFACILFHALYNTGRPLFPHDAALNPLVDNPAIHYLVIAVIALSIALLWDATTLKRLRFSIVMRA